MPNVIEAADALRAALATVEGVRHYPDVGPGVDPPATVLGVPSLEWGSMCQEPTSASWVVYLVVAADSARAASTLFQLLPRVVAALDAVEDAVVVRADPGTYPASSGDLPAYQIQIDVALGA